MERLRGVVVLADDVVERDDVLEALVLGGLRENSRIAPGSSPISFCGRMMPICMPRILSRAHRPRRNLQNACACELLALACRHGHPPGSQTAGSRRGRSRCTRPRAARERSGGRDAQRVQAAVRNRVAALTSAPAGQLAAADLARSLRVLDISLSEAGRLFGVSRSAVEQWLARGVPGGAPRARSEPRAHRRHPRAQPQARAHRCGRARAGARLRQAKSILDLVREGRDERGARGCWSRRSTGRARPDAPHRARRAPTCAWSIPPGPTRSTRRSRAGGGRWNPPGAFAALYLCRDVETARANARRLLDGQPFTFDDLLPERLPALVETTCPRLATSTP